MEPKFKQVDIFCNEILKSLIELLSYVSKISRNQMKCWLRSRKNINFILSWHPSRAADLCSSIGNVKLYARPGAIGRSDS